MSINIKLLKEKLSDNRMTVTQLSKELDIDERTYYRKINIGGGSFSIDQVQKIASVLNLSNDECIHIFIKSFV